MSIAVHGTYKNGQILLDSNTDWPDGCRVLVEPLNSVCGSEQGDDPASIARWIAEFDSIPPLQLTLEEEAEWNAARQAQKEFETATFEGRSRRLNALFP